MMDASIVCAFFVLCQKFDLIFTRKIDKKLQNVRFETTKVRLGTFGGTNCDTCNRIAIQNNGEELCSREDRR